jgi:hypothetical protein
MLVRPPTVSPPPHPAASRQPLTSELLAVSLGVPLFVAVMLAELDTDAVPLAEELAETDALLLAVADCRARARSAETSEGEHTVRVKHK